VVGGTLNCIGQSLISNWGSTPPQSVYNLCLVFRFGFTTMSLVLCGGWDFELHWAKSNIRLGFNSPSKCIRFVFSF
jgi:hypothetical protein